MLEQLPQPASLEENIAVAAAQLEEDKEENKRAAFDTYLGTAKKVMGKVVNEHTLVEALLESFTEGRRAGRPLEPRCEALLAMATMEVQKSKSSLQKKRLTGKMLEKSVNPETGSQAFQCTASAGCGRFYTTQEGLRLHVRNHHDNDKMCGAVAARTAGTRGSLCAWATSRCT